MNIEKLKAAYGTNVAVKAICDELASRERNQKQTSLERMEHHLQGDGLKRREIIAGFRLLEAAECGRYVEGRHGWRSRFEWGDKSLAVASAARGEQAPAQATEEEADDTDMIQHSYVLRPDLPVAIVLPDDLTATEAARLAGFLQTLPFSKSDSL